MRNYTEDAGFHNPRGNIATGEQMWYTFFENLFKKIIIDYLGIKMEAHVKACDTNPNLDSKKTC